MQLKQLIINDLLSVQSFYWFKLLSGRPITDVLFDQLLDRPNSLFLEYCLSILCAIYDEICACLQVLWHETELVSAGEGLVMSETDDDKSLRCVATVDGLLSNVTVATVAVRCQYQLTLAPIQLHARTCFA